jgi:hypothetical protein
MTRTGTRTIVPIISCREPGRRGDPSIAAIALRAAPRAAPTTRETRPTGAWPERWIIAPTHATAIAATRPKM